MENGSIKTAFICPPAELSGLPGVFTNAGADSSDSIADIAVAGECGKKVQKKHAHTLQSYQKQGVPCAFIDLTENRSLPECEDVIKVCSCVLTCNFTRIPYYRETAGHDSIFLLRKDALIRDISDRLLLTVQRNKSAERNAKPSVSVVTCTKRPDSIDMVFDNFKRQQNILKELIVVLNTNTMDKGRCESSAKDAGINNIKVMCTDQSTTLGECLNLGINMCEGDFISKMDDDDYYGQFYAYDLISTLKRTGAGICGKASYFVYFKENRILAERYPDLGCRRTRFVAGSTIVAQRDVFRLAAFSHVNLNEDTLLIMDCEEKGIGVYSSDRFNYAYIRGALQEHTWNICNKKLLELCSCPVCIDDFIPCVTM